MSEDAELLRRYAVEHSEAAFTELVRRHVDLVYSAALRLVNGDAHRAQDVTQRVFAEFARQARRLIGHPAPVGWLYTTTRLAALRIIRTERRRSAREQEATAMNELLRESTPEPDWVHLRPVLEDAMHELGEKDRHAVLLRFFQNKSLKEVGMALGLGENAARMRVTRALEKLHALLKYRGVTLSVAALGTVLIAEAVTAAPTGLAVTISSVALGSAAAGTGTTLTLIKLVTMTKVQAGIVCGIAVASAVASLQMERQAQAKMRQMDVSLQQQSSQLAQLQGQNEGLSNLLTQANSPNNSGDLVKLRDEVAGLCSRTNELTLLQEEKRRLQASLAKARQDLIGSNPGDLVFNKETSAKIDYMSDLGLAIREYTRNNHDRFPTNFEEAAALFPDRVRNETNFTPAQFEIVYHGNQLDAFNDTYAHPKRILLIRERQPWMSADGKWMKVYEAVNGRRWTVSLPYGDFETWEQQRILPPKSSNE